MDPRAVEHQRAVIERGVAVATARATQRDRLALTRRLGKRLGDGAGRFGADHLAACRLGQPPASQFFIHDFERNRHDRYTF